MKNFSANSYQRTRNLFNPNATAPYRLSRSRLENFLNCPRCFYLDRRLGIEFPPTPAFTLNSAVDHLLKKEFDGYRRLRSPHPLMSSAGINAIPFDHPMLETWREVFKGVQYHHQATNLLIFGAVDDIWIDSQKQLLVVDYKATSTDQAISMDQEYRQAYKRQMEIYQWLLRKQNLNVSNTGYFVYCNADKTRLNFNAKLDFTIQVMPYEGIDTWVESAIVAAHECLIRESLPEYTDNCSYCSYRRISQQLENPSIALKKSEQDRFSLPSSAIKKRAKKILNPLRQGPTGFTSPISLKDTHPTEIQDELFK